MRELCVLVVSCLRDEPNRISQRQSRKPPPTPLTLTLSQGREGLVGTSHTLGDIIHLKCRQNFINYGMQGNYLYYFYMFTVVFLC